MAELGTKRRVRVSTELPPTVVMRRRRPPWIAAGLGLWCIAIGVGAFVTTPPARRASLRAWGERAWASGRGWVASLRLGVGSAAAPVAPAAGDAAGEGGQGPRIAGPPASAPRPARTASPDAGVALGRGGATGGEVASAARGPDAGAKLPTCEAALHAHRDAAMNGANAGLMVTNGAYRSTFAQGSYLLDCEGAYDANLVVCAAVRRGQLIGVTVRADPPAPAVERCVAAVIAGFTLEPNLGLDVTEVHFAGH